MTGETMPVKGAWPNDPLGLFLQHAKSRKHMTKAQLLADAEAGDNAYLDVATERSMAEAYLKDLEAHLKAVHGCEHDIYADGVS